MNLNEAFKELDILEEDTFNVRDDDDIEELGSLVNDDNTDDVVNIIDAEAMNADELADSYKGKVILDCDVCHSLCYKDPEEIVIEDDAVVDMECPYCYSSEGFKVIGKVCSLDDSNEPHEDGENDDHEDDENDDHEETSNEEMPKEEESLKEAVTINTDDVTINTENSDDTVDEIEDSNFEVNNDETVQPLTDDEADEFEEKEISEVEESLLSKSINRYLKRVYENVNNFKLVEIKGNSRKIVVEGILNFNSGKTKPTSFTFKPHTVTKTGRVKFIGENLDISRGKKSFAITGRIKNNVFMTESLNYNYVQKHNNKSVKVQGTVNNR